MSQTLAVSCSKAKDHKPMSIQRILCFIYHMRADSLILSLTRGDPGNVCNSDL